MSSKSKPVVHPFTFFIVDCLHVIFESAMARKYENGYRAFYWLTGMLEVKDQELLSKEIKRMESWLNGQGTFIRDDFRKVQSAIMIQLHKQGYFEAAKWHPPDMRTNLEDMSKKFEKLKPDDRATPS
jgi:hypothetical protein